MLDEAEYRIGLILGVIDVALLDHRSDEDGRNARSRTPLVHDRRRDVIPASAELIVGDDDQRILNGCEQTRLEVLDNPEHCCRMGVYPARRRPAFGAAVRPVPQIYELAGTCVA